MVGRPRKPLDLRLIESGGKVRSRYAAREALTPKPKGGVGAPPRVFNAEQKAIWARVVKAAPEGLFAASDHDILTSYCVLLHARDCCVRELNETPATITRSADDRRDQVNPLLRELRRIAAQLQKLQAELGLTPLARGRMQVLPPPAAPDALDRFLR